MLGALSLREQLLRLHGHTSADGRGTNESVPPHLANFSGSKSDGAYRYNPLSPATETSAPKQAWTNQRR
jgi:hypothetical protein